MNNLQLFEIDPDIGRLLDMRDQAVEEGVPPEELAAIDQAIQAYAAGCVSKKAIDGTARAIATYEAAAGIVKEEIERLQERVRRLQARADRIRENALQAMQAYGVTKLETSTHRLTVCGNSGKEPLEIPEVSLLPEEYQLVTLRMPLWVLRKIEAEFSQFRPAHAVTLRAEPNQERIREALKQRVTCPECGAGDHLPVDHCPRCQGSGTIPNTVPGAKLLPRGVHLRVS